MVKKIEWKLIDYSKFGLKLDRTIVTPNILMTIFKSLLSLNLQNYDFHII